MQATTARGFTADAIEKLPGAVILLFVSLVGEPRREIPSHKGWQIPTEAFTGTAYAVTWTRDLNECRDLNPLNLTMRMLERGPPTICRFQIFGQSSFCGHIIDRWLALNPLSPGVLLLMIFHN